MNPKRITQLWLITMAIIAITAAPAFATLVVHYDMDDIDGINVLDSSGNGYDGVGTYTHVAGKIGSGALSFNGSSNYVTITDYKGILGNNSSSVSLWFKTADSLSNWPVLYVWGDDAVIAAADYMGFWVNIDVWAFSVAGPPYILSSGPFNDDTWHNAVTTYDGRYMKFYVDDFLQGSYDTGSGIDVQSINDVHIGASKDGAQSFFNGAIDDFRIYNTALSDSERGVLYGMGGGGVPEPATVVGLVIAAMGMVARRRLLRRQS